MLKLNLTPNRTITSNVSAPPEPPHHHNNPRTIAFTTPPNYATRLTVLINRHHHHNWIPLSTPTIITQHTSTTLSSLLHHLTTLHLFSAVAFTSRSGISAFSAALKALPSPPSLPPHPLTLAALGSDSHLLTQQFLSLLSPDPTRLKILLPDPPTPTELAHSLGPGQARKVLCPVPLVVDLQEPPVVPYFLNDLDRMGWAVVRADAYETRWAGPKCVEKLVEVEKLDALVFTSTAEVEGLLKGLKEIGLEWVDFRKKWAGLVVAAHGPVTATGARRLGVEVDVVSSKFDSFQGVVDALDHI